MNWRLYVFILSLVPMLTTMLLYVAGANNGEETAVCAFFSAMILVMGSAVFGDEARFEKNAG